MRSGDDTALGVIRAEFTRVVGESNETSELQQLAKVDVHDIDGWSSITAKGAGIGSVRVLHIREP